MTEKTFDEKLALCKNLLDEYEREHCKRARKKKAKADADGNETFTSDKGSNVVDTSRKRARRFSIVTYLDEKALRMFLSRSKWVQHFAFIVHDKDVNDDGTLKIKHIHLLLYTYDAKTACAVRKIFDRYAVELCSDGETPENTLVQITRDVISQYRYFMHLDNVDKVRYDEFSVVCDDRDYWRELVGSEGLNDSSQNVGFAIFRDVLNGTPTYELARRYGREYIINAKHYHDCVIQHLRESGGDLSEC